MSTDSARAGDGIGVGVRTALEQAGVGTTLWRVDRWDEEQTRWVKTRAGLVAPTASDFMRLGVESYLTTEVVGNLITNAGWTRLMNLLTAQGGTQALSATATRIGVGNSNTAEAYTDTDLLGASKYFQPVSGAGSLGTRTLAFSATFGTSDGNFAWNEFGLDVGTPTVSGSATVNALLFNRKAGIAQGTKASGQTWTATATITFT